MMTVDSNGFISVPPRTQFQTEFQPVITTTSERLISLLGHRLHSLYLYGSVAQGIAQSGVSDLDVCIILTQQLSQTEPGLLANLARDVASCYPIVSKVDFDIGELSDVLATENHSSWGYWLKHHCRCIYGEDLAQRFLPFKPSKAIAVAVNGDFIVVLEQYIEQLTRLTEGREQKQIQRAAARKLIRSTNLLRTETDSDWPETLDEFVTRLLVRYPQTADEIHYFLREGTAPVDSAASFIRRLTAFMGWLDITRQLEANKP